MGSKIKKLLRENPLFSTVVVIEACFLLWCAVRIAAPLCTLDYTPADFAEALAASTDLSGASVADGALVFAPETPQAQTRLQSTEQAVRSGAYTVTVDYDMGSNSTLDDTAAELTLRSASIMSKSRSVVMMDAIPLDGAHTTATGRLYIAFGARVNDLMADLVYNGGTVTVYNIHLQESRIYRVLRWLGLVLLCAAVDGVYVVLFSKQGCTAAAWLQKNWHIPVLFLISVLACSSQFMDALCIGSDTAFHIERIVMVAQELKNGQFPVRMMTEMRNGYGYPNPLFYCDLFLYLPAVLYNCMLPLRTCYQLYVVAITAVTCAIAYYAARRMLPGRGIAVVVASLYTLAGYRLAVVYRRFAVGEFTAISFLPLVVLGMYAIYNTNRPTARDWLPLSLGMAGLVQCHVLTVEMTGLFLILFCLLRLRATLRPQRLLAIGKAAAATVGLSAWFLLPFVESILTIPIVTVDWYYYIQQRGATLARQFALLPIPQGEGEPVQFSLGPALLLGILLIAAVQLQRSRWPAPPKTASLLKVCSLYGILATVISLRVFPWDALLNAMQGTIIHRLFGMVQSPYRYLTISTVLLCFAVGAALAVLRLHRPKLYRAAAVTLVAAGILYTGAYFSMFLGTASTASYLTTTASDTMNVGAGEYRLSGSEKVDLTRARSAAQSEALLVKWYDKTNGEAHITLENTGGEETAVLLPIFDYGHYKAADAATGEEMTLTTGEGMLLQLAVPAGYSGSVTVRYAAPWYWHAAEAVSLLTAAVLAAWAVRKKAAGKRGKNGPAAPA